MDSLRVLIVDDDPAIIRLLDAVLQNAGVSSVTHVTSAERALAQAGAADVVLLDHQLPDFEGVDLLRSFRDRPEPPSVVMITAHGNEALAAESLRRGADDYLVKDGTLPNLLPKVLERVRRERALKQALQVAEAELVQAERRAAMGEMTVTLHHEINNPLMAASAEVDLLLSAPEALSPVQREGLTEVRVALGRIRDIVKRIGSLSEARSATYVGTTRMIELSGTATPPPAVPAVARGAALLCMPDEALARVVTLLLRQAGWSVRRCHATSELPAMASTGENALVIFASTHEAPNAGLPPASQRSYRVMALAGEGVSQDATGADLVVRVPFDPAALGRELAEM
ncbi:MAG TPA: response regulator [Gemmatimonadales bacterium]|nr:response regulator [Gemmatimonadales bacterium]HET8632648.1 response regulator [Gemmatimonadales bacterium]